MRALSNLFGAFAGLMLILVGGMVPSAIILPSNSLTPEIVTLSSTWQVPSLLIFSLVSGPKVGMLSAIAYLTIGLFYIPIFEGGGGLEYILTPNFGYLLGFIPAAWLSGKLSQQEGISNIFTLTLSALAGLMLIHICGVLNILVGIFIFRWSFTLPELIFDYSITPLLSQIALCTAVGIVAKWMRSLLLIE